MSIQSLAAAGADTSEALSEISERISSQAGQVRFVYAFYGCDHDGAAIHAFLGEKFPEAALEDADCPGELPELIWVYQAPGREEEVIDELRRVVGDRCPIIGGSSADNTVEGNWHQLGPDGVLEDGLVVGVLFPAGGVFSRQRQGTGLGLAICFALAEAMDASIEVASEVDVGTTASMRLPLETAVFRTATSPETVGAGLPDAMNL